VAWDDRRVTSRRQRTFTLEEAARELGVHYMTVYRYVRLGRLPATRREGRWVIRGTDLDAFDRRAASRTGPTATERGRADWARHRPRLVERLVAGDEGGAWDLVERVIAAGAQPIEVHLELLVPAMHTVGDRWEAGTLDVGQEHTATAVAMRIVGRLGPRFVRRGRRRGTVLLAAPPDELHGLPLAIVADVTRAEGFDVVDLGANTPVGSIVHVAEHLDRLVAVGIGISTAGARDGAREAVAALHATLPQTPAVVGGRAVAAHAPQPTPERREPGTGQQRLVSHRHR
jgi:excisionase family DNA binding protein